MDELENALKEAYNNYIDALVAYLGDIKQNSTNLEGAFDNATKYILDNHISVGFRDSLEIVRAGSTDKLLAKKVI